MESHEINQTLEEMPALKASASEKSITALRAMEAKEIEHDRLYGTLFKKYADMDYTPSEVKAILLGNEELCALRTEITRLKYEAKFAERDAVMFDDKFTAVKVIARLRIAELGGGLEHVQ